jgi:predicted ATPase/class 3 adenylate cyclase
MPDLPTGTVTFLFTDVEGSTRGWERHPDAMKDAVTRHEAILRAAIEAHGGQVFRTVGDGLCAAFPTAPEAVAAAFAAQRDLWAEPWDPEVPLRTRIALHTGAVEVHRGDYVGACLNRLGRLLAAAHGGQVLLSQTTCDLVRDHRPAGTGVRELGEQRLRDLERPERVFQLVHPALPADFPPPRSLDTLPNNLPLQLTSFVGREREIADVMQLLRSTRLVTLAGAGGCGKTRLALQVAADLLDAFPDGAWFVDLAPLTDAALVSQAIAAALNVREVPGQDTLATIIEYLRGRHVLLVLDNCEHLIDGCARLSQTILRGGPRIQILATSREMLGVPGETTWRVPSLATPDPQTRPTYAVIAQSDAICLFVDRARAVVPTFGLTADNAAALLRICHRLDGIPLAIELAAARVRVLTVEQILARLADRFRFLTGGSRTALRRQQTLRATIDWSYDLLTEPERILLRRLSVFAGGWILAAAEAVCGGGNGDGPALDPRSLVSAEDVLDLLTQLVDKSFVLAEGQGGEQRYRLLETVRQYAAEKLFDAGEVAQVRARHRAWCLRVTEQGVEESWATWRRRLAPEHDNFRAALEWSRAEGAESVLGLRLAANLGEFWNAQDTAEGRSWLDTFLALVPEPTLLRARALAMTCHLARWGADPAAARRLAEEELAICREIGDQGSLSQALYDVGMAFANEGDYPEARTRLEQSLAIRQEIGDQGGICWTYNDLGLITLAEGDLIRARRYLDDGLARAPRRGFEQGIDRTLYFLACIDRLEGEVGRARQRFDRFLREPIYLVMLTPNLPGSLAQAEGDFAGARAVFVDHLRQAQERGDRAQVAQQVGLLGILAQEQGGYGRAARLLAAAARVDPHFAPIHYPEIRCEARRAVDQARARLGDDAFEHAWADGQAMTLEQAVARALEEDGDA